MNAGELAKLGDISKDTLRYYEQIGLISKPQRDANGYRRFAKSHLQELKFIKLAQSVGFTLNEIKPVIPRLLNPDPGCPELAAALANQIQRVDAKIAELQDARATLNRWLTNHLAVAQERSGN